MIPTSTDVTIEIKNRLAVGLQAVAVFVSEGATDGGAAAEALAEDERIAIERLLQSGVSRGRAREVHFDLVQSAQSPKPPTQEYRRVLVAGLGKPKTLTTESIRQAAGALARLCRKQRLVDVAAVVPALEGISASAAAEAIVTGFLLASFHYQEYKGAVAQGDKEQPPAAPVTLTIVGGGADAAEVREGVRRGQIIANAQNFARTIASRPGNNINPPSLAKVAVEMAKETGLTSHVLDEKEMARLGMGGILAVGSGSHTPPRMIVLEYSPAGAAGAKKGSKKSAAAKAQAPLLVVGKGITFDSGGISIKPADKMGRMVFDKCGAMAVLGLMCAIAKLKPAIRVVGILSSAENLLGSHSYRPGDIIRHYNGVTSEITNTDAEGRLVLADALAWGIETFKPRAVVDLATLTGGVVIALGSTMAGALGNNDELFEQFQQACLLTGEKIWRLPVNDDHRDYMKSNHADIVNAGGREASASQGAAYLSHFVPRDDSVPWLHLDIAGVADSSDKELPYYEKGATGWGVRALVEWVMRQAQGE